MLKNIFKGFIIGIGKIIPGVSGALLAMMLGVYDKALLAITGFFDNMKENIKLLSSLAIGVIFAILVFSKVINYALNNYYVITMFFFIGLIVGGLVHISKNVKKKNIYITILSFIFIIILAIPSANYQYVLRNNFLDNIIFFISGILEAIGTVIPGVSSTALLMMIGIYKLVIEMIGNLSSISYIIANISILLPFTLGLILGLILISLLMNFLLRKYYDKTYAFIFGVTLASIILLIIRTFNARIYLMDIFLGIILFILGFIVSYKLDK